MHIFVKLSTEDTVNTRKQTLKIIQAIFIQRILIKHSKQCFQNAIQMIEDQNSKVEHREDAHDKMRSFILLQITLLKQQEIAIKFSVFHDLIQTRTQYNQVHLEMALPIYHEDLCALFERADSPFIFGRKSTIQYSLDKFIATPTAEKESIKAMKSILNALLYLRQNFIMPCQLKYQYVVYSKQKWGLCHAICERSQEILEQKQDSYNPEEYIFHLDSENQLVWNFGKIWIRFFTEQPVKIKHNTQKKVDALIDSLVTGTALKQLLKKILCLDKVQRIPFQSLLTEEILSNDQQQSKFYSSLLVHLKNMSGIMGSKNGIGNFQLTNPFIRQVNYRRFTEYLDVDMFLQNVKSDIRKQYSTQDEGNKAILEFALYIISLQNYKNMIRLNTERMEIGERFEEIQDRIYYAKFTKRMIILKETLVRKSKVLAKGLASRKTLLRLLEDPDSINEQLVYNQFKSSLKQYMEALKDDLNSNKNDTVALKLLTKIMIARTSIYVFDQYRMEIFQSLFKNDKNFGVKKVYTRINECIEVQALWNVIKKIQVFYFTQ